MRFLANENFPQAAVVELRQIGHDVVWVRSDAPGSTDPDILAWAMRENRVLLTFDKDFGHLAFAAGLPATCGILLFRLTMPPPDQVGSVLAARIAARTDWVGHFSVIENDRVRMRPV
jgi:predicted nuclease of predicted toxin-antitoxin system